MMVPPASDVVTGTPPNQLLGRVGPAGAHRSSPQDGEHHDRCQEGGGRRGKASRTSRTPATVRVLAFGMAVAYVGCTTLLCDPGPVPSAPSTAGGTEFDTPLGVSSTTTSSRRPKVRDRTQGSNSATLFHPCTLLSCAHTDCRLRLSRSCRPSPAAALGHGNGTATAAAAPWQQRQRQ